MDRSSVGSSDREQADAGLAKFMLEWRVNSALNSLRGNLTDNKPSLNQVECFLYMTRKGVEEAAAHSGISAQTLSGFQQRYDKLRAQALIKFPNLTEYGMN